MDLVVNEKHLTTFMCTPAHLKELAVGHLTARRLVDSLVDIHMLGACDDMRKIYVRIAQKIPEAELTLGHIIPSACGSGSVIQSQSLQGEKIDSDFKINPDVLRSSIAEMHHRAERYKETGGLHSAALVDGNKIVEVQEDVGRHNAIDKIIGAAVLKKINLEKSALITTGRLSSDIVLKAIGGGVPVLASRSIPTSMALELAETVGITLVGRGHRSSPYIYCCQERITGYEAQSLHTR